MAVLQHRHIYQLVAFYVCLLASMALASREFLPDEIAEALQALRKHKSDNQDISSGAKLSQNEQESPVVDPPGIMTKRLAMPNVLPHQDDVYSCSPARLIDEDQAHIVGFKPEPQSAAIDRIELYGCLQAPASDETAWACTREDSSSYCFGPGVLMYEWTREGCEDYLAKGETITVGGPFIRNVVLMVHYMKGGATDTSGITIKLLPNSYPSSDLNTAVDYYSKTFRTDCETTSSSGDDDPFVMVNKAADNRLNSVLNDIPEMDYSDYSSSLQNEVEQSLESSYRYGGFNEGGLEIVNRWPLRKVKLGQVSGVATDKEGRVYLFQRGERMWKQGSYQPEDYKGRGPIKMPTVITLDPKTGTVIDAWGSKKFYMPHGLTVDDEGNVWLTDVALHQVFKFPPGETRPSMVLGEAFTSGEDTQHFCKPTDVAVESKTGNFFVADGYCNSRVLKFAENGTFLMEITAHASNTEQSSRLNSFQIPHSLALAERRQLLCVADRENARIQCFNSTTGAFVHEIARQEFAGSVYAVTYDDRKDVLYAINGRTNDPWYPTQGFTLDIEDGTILDVWQPPYAGFGDPHDVAVYSPDGSVYVADIGYNRVWKFEEMEQAVQDNAIWPEIDRWRF